MKHSIYSTDTYWHSVWLQYRKRRLGVLAILLVIFFCLVGIYAPFLASSKPLCVLYDGVWYFPLFRYLFFSGFYTKLLDIFFNLLIFTFPIGMIGMLFSRRHPRLGRSLILMALLLQLGVFTGLVIHPLKDPAADPTLNKQRQAALAKRSSDLIPDWTFALHYMSPYERLNLVLKDVVRQKQQACLLRFASAGEQLPTLWQMEVAHEASRLEYLQKSHTPEAEAEIAYLVERRKWLSAQSAQLHFLVMPLVRPYHWEDDAGGGQALNQKVPWWELTRINRKDLVAALIFGVRISLVVGFLAVSVALAIGVPVGALAGFYGGTFDIVVCRLLEIWESMPIFFMLLLVVAIAQSKSIFLVITVIGLFGWTGFSRYIRGEFFKQRNLAYVEACQSQGFGDSRIVFSHILPNAIPPLLTLLPFAIMGAITGEAGLSFLGLGEEGSCSWGVLMDEGRNSFPGESALLWPPALLLTILLVAIAIVGDTLRDALDPKLRR